MRRTSPKEEDLLSNARQLSVQGKRKVAQYFLLIFFQKEKEIGSRVFQKNGSVRTKKQTGSVQAFQDWRTKQSRQQKNSWVSQKTVQMVEVASEYSEEIHSAPQDG